ncbi:MAG: hypothetical protein M3268_02650 [Acidobacteriota bacterium]|nr:hypothetical protein [Acidobacteriota bacterium]
MEKRPAGERADRREGERGAALMLALMVSLLLLLVGGALITNTMLSATNMNDATPEVQAYYGAEAGLQAAMLVLRGNASPTPLFTPNPAGGVDDANKIDFRGAVTNSTSNLSGDPTSTGFPARLSRWLQYNYTPSGGSYADRVVVSSGTYSPMTGVAYALRLTDPDNSSVVTYSTAGVFNSGSNVATTTNGVGTLKITYNAQSSTTVTAYPQANAQSLALGTFGVTATGTGTIPVQSNTQLTLRVSTSAPYSGYMLVGGTITGSVTAAAGVITSSTLKITFANASLRVRGTLFTFVGYSSGTSVSAYSIGGATGISPSPFPLRVTVFAPSPERLLVTSYGYGPRGSRRQLTMEVSKYLYNISPPAPIVIRGSDTAGDLMTFDLGSSNAKYYTGKDHANIQAQQPTVAISLKDWKPANDGLVKGNTVADPKLSILDIDTIPSPWASPSPVPSTNPVGQQPGMPPTAQTPDFLVTADAARTFLNDVQTVAQNNGRYYTSLSGYADSANNSANANNPALTFVDGDCTLDGGSGLLVVTGTLTLNGNSNFSGVILVMGTGKVVRSGGGNANIYGSWIVAKFSRTGTTGFTAPTFDVSGGGNANFQFDTTAIDNALHVLGLRVAGVAET